MKRFSTLFTLFIVALTSAMAQTSDYPFTLTKAGKLLFCTTSIAAETVVATRASMSLPMLHHGEQRNLLCASTTRTLVCP